MIIAKTMECLLKRTFIFSLENKNKLIIIRDKSESASRIDFRKNSFLQTKPFKSDLIIAIFDILQKHLYHIFTIVTYVFIVYQLKY